MSLPYKSKEQQRAYQQNWHIQHKDENKCRSTRRRKARKQWLQKFLSKQKCAVCSETENSCLDFHHINPKTKHKSVSWLISKLYPWQTVIDEVKKCVIICANCHRKHHANKLNTTFNESQSVDISNELEPS